MKIAIIDYETGNLKSVSKALELASNNVLKRSNIEIINSAKDLNNFDMFTDITALSINETTFDFTAHQYLSELNDWDLNG